MAPPRRELRQLVCWVVRWCVWAQVDGGKCGPAGSGGGSGSRAVQTQKETTPWCRSRWHRTVTALSLRTPARCPLLPSSPVFWGLTLGFLLGVMVVYWVLASALVSAPLSSAPRYLRCWHFTGLLQRPFARPALSRLLSAVHYGAGGAVLAGLRELRPLLPEVSAQVCREPLRCAVLCAEDRPGSTFTDSKGGLLPEATTPAPEIGWARSPNQRTNCCLFYSGSTVIYVKVLWKLLSGI